MKKLSHASAALWTLSLGLFYSNAPAQSAGALVSDWKENIALPVRERLQEIIAAAPRFATEANATLVQASPDGTLGWYLSTALVIVACAAVGVIAAFGVQRWGRNHFVYLFSPEPVDRAERIGFLLLRCVLQLVGVIVFYAVATLVWLVFGGDSATAQATQEPFYDATAAVWAAHVIIGNVLASDTPSHRMLNIPDGPAHALYRSFSLQFIITGAIAGTCMWMGNLGLSPYPHVLILIGGSFIAAAALCAVVIVHRESIATIALGPAHTRNLGPARFLANTWHIAAVVYLMAAWATSAVRLMLGMPAAVGLIIGPIGVLFLALAVYGALLWVIDRVAARHAAKTLSVDSGADSGAHDAEILDITDASAPLPPGRTFTELAEHAAALLAWFGAVWLVLSIWGVDVYSEHSALVRLSDVIFIIFLSYLGYETVKVAIDRKIIREGGFEVGEPGDEGGGGSASRLATLLPLFRNFILITLVVIASMIALSELGIDIAPLFAGAGVVGLAVGFGSQALIRDIFSGAFFLVDDAFRLGEYLNIEGTRGTVEKISVRSMQLRHHLGALHTIPFGEIKQLTNHSRDWAMMKLELRLTYETDVERVRKLIKNLGKELLEDPEIGDKFIQPLKSQGVFRMEDSAMIVRVKYMTRPGDQFVIRKQVYARLREIFAAEGIHFAHREVTVRVAQNADTPADGGAPGISPAFTPELAGAVLPAIDSGPTGSGASGR
ncbi:MAG: small-conductance mechanosensitive channel [Gammaproteobacteria bacterium]|jgi:small-conductance mechanosensitive channel